MLDLPETVAGVPYSNPDYTYYAGLAKNARSDRLYGATLHLEPASGSTLELTSYRENKSGHGVSPDSYANSLIYYTEQAEAGLAVTAPRGVQYGYSGLTGHRQGAVLSASQEIGDHRIDAGAWIESDRYHRTQYRLNLEDGAPDGAVLADEVVYYRRNYRSHRDTLQYWLRDRWTPGQGRLTIEAGIKGLDMRYGLTGYRDFDDYAHADGSPGWGPQSGKAHWSDGFLPSLGALYRLDGERTQVFASYAQNMAMPKGMDTIASTAFASTSAFAPIPKAERAQNFEVGIRTKQPCFYAVATLYHTYFSNLISALSVTAPGDASEVETYYVNVGAVEAHGAEASATVKPAFLGDKAYFTGTLTYSDATFLDDLPATTVSAATAIRGKRLPDSARWIVSGSATVEPTRWSLLGVSARYTGKRFADYANTQSVGGQLVVDAYAELGHPAGSARSRTCACASTSTMCSTAMRCPSSIPPCPERPPIGRCLRARCN
ncbi:TonB-dependent receptor domain-containing protein [Novosphingobium sp. 9]|uniref:TonB-dependent receptor domain-containing protein n=1 Tax=Novosphingobium sp. 9 TaxID=2025349 RepID=UPI0021B6DA00|nr:TonB-dependent receptor [Novosphingobium sp. 9]